MKTASFRGFIRPSLPCLPVKWTKMSQNHVFFPDRLNSFAFTPDLQGESWLHGPLQGAALQRFLMIYVTPKMGIPPKHPNHETIWVLKPMVTLGSPPLKKPSLQVYTYFITTSPTVEIVNCELCNYQLLPVPPNLDLYQSTMFHKFPITISSFTGPNLSEAFHFLDMHPTNQIRGL